MKRSLLLRLFFLLLLSWFYTVAVSIAQTPAADLDSITEDSYQRMLARQAAEQKSDTLMTSHAEPVVQEQISEEEQGWNYLLFIFAFFLIWLIFRYYRKVYKTKAKPKI